MSFSDQGARAAQNSANDLDLQDAHLQRRTIIGDEDGFWLTRQLEQLQVINASYRDGSDRQYRFLCDDAELIVDRLNDSVACGIIEMPAQSIIRRTEGTDYATWVFRVHNGLWGSDEEYFDVAYREIAPGAQLLYLKAYYGRHEIFSR